MNAHASFPPYAEWTWQVPEFFNIGVACTDAHLDSDVEQRIAMIVEDDSKGTITATYRDLSERSSQFAQLLRKHDIAGTPTK